MLTLFAIPMILGWLWSLVGGLGIPGLVALGAGLLLVGGLRRFAATPKGLLVMGGVLAAALALPWLWNKLALAGGLGGLARQARELTAAERLAAEQAAQKRAWKKWN